MDRLAYLKTLERRSLGDRFGWSGLPSYNQTQNGIEKAVNTVLEKISKSLPNDAARRAALHALHLDGLVDTVIAEFQTKEIPIYETDPATGKPRIDPRTNRPIQAMQTTTTPRLDRRGRPMGALLSPGGILMAPPQPVMGPHGPIPDPADPTKFLMLPPQPQLDRSGRPIPDPANPPIFMAVHANGSPIPATRMRRVKTYHRAVPGVRNAHPTVYRANARNRNGTQAAQKLLAFYEQ